MLFGFGRHWRDKYSVFRSQLSTNLQYIAPRKTTTTEANMFGPKTASSTLSHSPPRPRAPGLRRFGPPARRAALSGNAFKRTKKRMNGHEWTIQICLNTSICFMNHYILLWSGSPIQHIETNSATSNPTDLINSNIFNIYTQSIHDTTYIVTPRT